MDTALILGEVRIDLALGVVERDGQVLILAPKEVEVLVYLSQRANQDVHREELYAEVWGYRANVVSRTLDTTIRRLRTKIESNPSEPEYLRTVHAFGYRLVIPEPEPGRWIERSAERAAVERLVRRGPVLLAGAPGMGASTLAQQWADSRSEPVRWIDGDADPAEVVAAILSRGALVVDGVDLLSPGLIRAVDRRDPSDPLVVTGQDHRGWRWSVFQVPPMSDADARSLALREWMLGGGSEPAPIEELNEIVRLVDGVPASIISAARSAATLGPGLVLEQLRRPTRSLSVPLCARIQAEFAKGWERLGDPGRVALITASMFGAMTPSRVLVEVLADVDPGGTLVDLADRGLLAVGGPDGVIRVPWHVRVCAGWFATDEQRAEALRTRDRWAMRTARGIERGLENLEVPERWLLAPLTGAWDSRESWSPGDLVALARALVALCDAHGPAGRVLPLLDQAVEAVEGRDAAAEARLRLERAARRLHFNDPGVLSDVDRAVQLLGGSGGGPLLVRAHGVRAVHLQSIGRPADADRALAAATQAAACTAGEGALQYAGGLVAHHRGRLDEACDALRAAHAAAIVERSPVRVRDTLAKIAVVLVDAGKVDEAAAALEQCLALGPAVGRDAALLHGLKAQVALVRGQLAEAEAAYGQVLLQVARCDCPDALASAAIGLANTQIALGRPADAAQSTRVALEAYRRHRSPIWLGLGQATLGLVHHASGELDEAIEVYQQALQTIDPLGSPYSDLCLPLWALAEASRGGDASVPLARFTERAAFRTDPLATALDAVIRQRIGGAPEATVNLPSPWREIVGRLPGPSGPFVQSPAPAMLDM